MAVCQIDLLERQRNDEGIQIVLRNMPKTIYDTYIRIFQEIPEDDRQFVRSTLEMICGHDMVYETYPYQSRVFVSELLPWVEADLQNGNNTSHQYGYDGTDLGDLCGCLVDSRLSDWPVRPHGEIQEPADAAKDPRNLVVRLAHYTVREFLESQRIRDSSVNFFALSRASIVTEFSLNIMRPCLSH